MKTFKFLQKERVFSDYMDAMDDYFLGGIQPNRNYDDRVNTLVKNRMCNEVNWRGYTEYVREGDHMILLKILGGMNMGGWMHIQYSITRNGVDERHTAGFPLSDLQRD